MTDIEQQLSDMLDATASRGSHLESDPVLHRLHLLERRRARRKRIGSAMGALALLGAGAAVIGLQPAERATLPDTASAPQCQQLEAVGGPAPTGASADSRLFVQLINATSEASCSVDLAGLRVELLMGPKVLPVSSADSGMSGVQQLRPGESLSLHGSWSNWCTGAVPAARIRLSWGAGSASTDDFLPSPSCVALTKPALLSVRKGEVAAGGRSRIAEPSAAAAKYRSALEAWAACLRAHGARVTGPRRDFTVSVDRNDDSAVSACAGLRPTDTGGYDVSTLIAAEDPGTATSDQATYPVNEYGLTYGSSGDAPVGLLEPGDEPDLVSVSTDQGKTGYVYNFELQGATGDWADTPDMVRQLETRSAGSLVLDAYESDGVTVVGTFTLGR